VSETEVHKPKFHGRRKGRPLGATLQTLLFTQLPYLSFPIEQALDPLKAFDTPLAELWLEIGFGGGEQLAAQAQAHPDVAFIGAEAYLNGVATLVREIQTQSLRNIRIWPHDVRDLLKALPEGCLSKIFILFPDPWPKGKHTKRRLINTQSLKQIARLLKPGADLIMASDHAGYIKWIQDHSAQVPELTPASTVLTRPSSLFPTRYEKKALNAGIVCSYMHFRRSNV
jgi:tRNA (guanine-N7-)-methyltransferase